jgi:hypothetical protein
MIGRKVRCSKCSRVLTAQPEPVAEPEQPSSRYDRNDEDEPRPGRRRFARKKSGSSSLPLIIGGGAALLVVLLVCGGLAFVVWRYSKPETNANVTQANYERIQTGMTLAQVEAILGPGKEPRPHEFDKLLENEEEKHQDMLDAMENAYDDDLLYRWRNGDTGVWIIFTQPPKSGGKVQYLAFVTQNGAKMQVVSKGKLPEPPKFDGAEK